MFSVAWASVGGAGPGGEVLGGVAVDADAEHRGDAVGPRVVVALGVRVAQPDRAVRLVVLEEALHEDVEAEGVAGRLGGGLLGDALLRPRLLLGGERRSGGKGRRL